MLAEWGNICLVTITVRLRAGGTTTSHWHQILQKDDTHTLRLAGVTKTTTYGRRARISSGIRTMGRELVVLGWALYLYHHKMCNLNGVSNPMCAYNNNHHRKEAPNKQLTTTTRSGQKSGGETKTFRAGRSRARVAVCVLEKREIE